MKIKRFFAPDMRTALRKVRETLGSDAVILSNKRVDGGVELVAAMDYDEAAFTPEPEPEPPAMADVRPLRPPQSEVPKNEPYIGERREPPAQTLKLDQLRRQRQPAAKRVEWSQDPLLQEMRREMSELRRMMELELSELTWRDLGERSPQKQELMRQLMELGLSADLCRKLAERVDATESPEQAWRQAMFHLIGELPVMDGDMLEQGGVIALVGPTGVGKTTSIAKLAARFCLRQGSRSLALITCDSYRIGAQEQLHNYGRILNVPVRSATSADELSDALHTFSGKRLVLIDTAGMSQRDLQFSERLSLITAGNHPVTTLLTLSATTQRAAMNHAVNAFRVANPVGVVLTKMDEAASLGGVFSTLIEAGLPLAFTTDGQRVPEELHLARAHTLVSQAIELAQEAGEVLDEAYLALAFGGTGEHAHV
jgi:flagellar biosynthesis protein FlhF